MDFLVPDRQPYVVFMSKIENARRIPRHDRVVMPVDTGQPVHQPRNVVQIGHGTFAVAAGLEVHDRRRSAAGSGMHPPPANLDIMRKINAVQGKLAAGAGDHVFDQRAGKAQAAIPVHPGPRRPRP